MSEELNSLLEKHKQLEERSIFKTTYQTPQQSLNVLYPQTLQDCYSSVHFVPQENWLHPVPQFPQPQYLQIPSLYCTHNFLPTVSQPFVYPQFFTPMQPPLPIQSPPPLPPAPAPSPPVPVSTSISTSSGKVYVNPNYNRNVVHGNSHLQKNSSIYVNPKLMPNCPKVQNTEYSSQVNIQSKHSRLDDLSSENKIFSNGCAKRYIKKKNDSFLQQNVLAVNSDTKNFEHRQISCLPNETFLSNNVESDSEVTIVDVNDTIKSNDATVSNKSPKNVMEPETIVVKNSKESENNFNSNLLVLSKRKLVRIPKSPEKKLSIPVKTLTKRKLSVTDMKKSKTPSKKLVLPCSNNLEKAESYKYFKSNWCNKFPARKKLSPKKTLNDSSGLVSIGGIEYKTSRNRLIRSNPNVSSAKREKSLSSKTSQYYDVETGAELIEVKLPENKTDYSFDSPEKSKISVQSFKTTISNKVKQRCLQILRKKQGKNNQFCLFFQRYGYCANQLTCSKIHEKKRVAACGNFLQGKCLLDSCRLSHNIGPEKMPTCKYFLEGCCARDDCPYTHVKVPSKNPICVEFLQGYCPQGDECQKRHVNACPEFDRCGKCRKGKYCQYPHKPIFSNKFKSLQKSTQQKNHVFKARRSEVKPTVRVSRKRYYDNSSEDLSKSRGKFLKSLKITKSYNAVQSSVYSVIKDKNVDSETSNVPGAKMSEEKLDTLFNKPKRSPIGPLPAYIPIG